MNYLRWIKRLAFPVLALAASTLAVSATHVGHASAACTALPTDRGTVTSTMTVPATGTYRVWSRIRTADTSKNSYLLQIDQSVCGVVVGNGTISANTWTWVDYQGGVTTTKIDVSLTAGSHTVVMAGREDNVEVDRLVFTQDLTCVPTGTGDNCANPPDTTAPVINISSPANNASIGSTTTVTATATDDVAIAKVEFYVDGVLVTPTPDTTPPYTYSLNPAGLSVGAHTLQAKAYDTATPTANSSMSGIVNFTVPDTTPPTVSLTTPTAGATVSGTTTLSATASDNIGVTRVDWFIDGGTTAIATDNLTPFSASYTTTGLTNGTHTLTAKAFDAAGNSTTSAPVSVTVNNVSCSTDTTPPTVSISHPLDGDVMSGTAYAVTASATDAVCGVKQVTIYVDNVAKTPDTTSPFTYTLDTTTLSNGTHTFKAVAIDNAATPNSATSATVTATVSNVVYIPEDVNQDTHVNLLDFSLLSGKFGQTGAGLGRTDINGDGTVNLLDFSRLASKYGL